MTILLLRVFSACAHINKITWMIRSVNLKRICCATFVKHPHSVWALRTEVMFFEFSLTGDLAFFSQEGWGWQGALEVLMSNPEAQAGPPQAQDCVQLASEYLWQRRCHNLSGSPVLVLLSLWWKCFLMFRGNLLFQFVPFASGPITGLHWEGPGSLFALSLQIFMHKNLPQACSRLISPSCLGFPHRRDSPVPWSSLWPFLGLSPICPCAGGWVCSYQCWVEGKDHPLNHWQCSSHLAQDNVSLLCDMDQAFGT